MIGPDVHERVVRLLVANLRHLRLEASYARVALRVEARRRDVQRRSGAREVGAELAVTLVLAASVVERERLVFLVVHLGEVALLDVSNRRTLASSALVRLADSAILLIRNA